MHSYAEIHVIRPDGLELLRYKKLPRGTAEVVAQDIYETDQFRQVKVRDLETGEDIMIFPLPLKNDPNDDL